MKNIRFVLPFLMCGLAVSAPALAQSVCDVTYTAQQGDTPSRVAQLHYADPDRWTWVTGANPDLVQGQGDPFAQGDQVFIPCMAPNTDRQGATLVQEADVMLSAPDGFAPLVSRTWPAQGMLNDLLATALSENVAPVVHAINWQDEGSGLDPKMLAARHLDMAVVLARPDCSNDPAPAACAAFHFSDPFVELPVLLFVRPDAGFTFQTHADLGGLRLCQPAVHATQGGDQNGTPWISDATIQLEAPSRPEACFQMLMEGQVDAVALNALSGSSTIAAMGLNRQIVALDRPLTRQALHIAVPKVHWRGTTLIYRLNSGLASLRASGRYDQILDRHMALLWNRLN